jgi:hypothetical protein
VTIRLQSTDRESTRDNLNQIAVLPVLAVLQVTVPQASVHVRVTWHR